MKLTRNQFFKVVIGGGAWLVSSGFAQRIRNAVTDAARPLPLAAVRLTGGPLKQAQELDAKYLLQLEPDRMLAPYRRLAGLEPRGEPYSGWDGGGRNLTGHICGHYLSAVSLMFAATGDARLKDRADYIVSELKIVQDKWGDGFAGALEGVREAFTAVASGTIKSATFDLNGLWSPWYTLHKTYGGLRDAYRYTGNGAALEVETRFAAWAERLLTSMTADQIQRMLNTEFGGMNEVLADLYADTGEARWLDLSRRFEHNAVLDPLKRREDPLDGLHGNCQIPKLIGSAARYTYAGDEADHTAATFFWERVAHHHTFATGGHGKDEYFREPDTLSHITEGRTAETCNVYNMLKLTRRLFALRPDVQYAEFHERALFNHILGSMDPESGATCYMVPVGRGVRREYQDMSRSFTCCVGSGLESHALHGLGLYYEAGHRLWVNLYAPSTAEWEAAGVKLTMETTFPLGDAATLSLDVRAPKAFTLALRRPSWAGDGFNVKVNGTFVTALPQPGGYVEIDRTWRAGDTVSLVLPKRLRIERLADDPTRAAILWGPLVLAGDLGPSPERNRTEGLQPAPGAPALVTALPADAWLKPVAGRPGTFRTAGVAFALDESRSAREVDLAPFYTVHRRTYAAYWDLLTQVEYSARLGQLSRERVAQRQLAAASVAFVPAGESDAEKPFNPRGEDTTIVRVDGRPGRRGAKWFSYDVPIDPSTPLTLVVTYNSDNRRPRTFDVLLDGARIHAAALPQSSVSRFVDEQYPIPRDLLRDKTGVTVRFEATGGNEIAAVFGVRIIRPLSAPAA
jgi:uncharacterized protein